MRPIELELRWFGQYAVGQTVRFDRLDKVFLITGETGAGKTTLFDAMAYALYGRGLGSRSAGSGLRSQLAGAEDSTVVRFVFEVNGARWEVERSPYKFVRRKRTGTIDWDSYVKLQRLTGPGAPELVAPDEIADKLHELLVLKFEDFSKILVLPQGEFQQFLAMKSADRAKLLKTLFPVRRHELVAKLAKDEASGIRGQVDEIDARAKEARRDFDPATFGAQDEALSSRLVDLRAIEVSRLGEQNEAVRVSEEARSLAGLFSKHRERVARRDAHEAGRGEHEGAKRRLKVGRDAASALPAVKAEATLRGELQRLETQLGEARTAHALALAGRQELEPAQAGLPARDTALRDATQVVEALKSRLVDLRELAKARVEERANTTKAATAAASAATVTALVAKAQASVAELDSLAVTREAAGPALLEARGALAACRLVEQDASAVALWSGSREPALQSERRSKRARLEALGGELIEADNELAAAVARVEADAALLLAATLRDGEACPVCGGLEHPSPRSGDAGGGDALALRKKCEKIAKTARDLRDTQSELVAKVDAGFEAERAAAREASDRLLRAGYADPSAWTSALDAARSVLEPLEREDGVRAVVLAERPARNSALAKAKSAAELAADAARAAFEALARASGAVVNAAARLGEVGEVDAEIATTDGAMNAAVKANQRESDAIAKVRAAWVASENAIVAAAANVAALNGQLEERTATLTSVASVARAALADAGFDTAAAAFAADVLPRDLEALQKRVDLWERELSSLTAQIGELELGIAGRAEPDVAAAEAAEQTAADAARVATRERSEVEAAQNHLRAKSKRIAELDAERDALLADSRGLLLLARHLNGEVAPKIDFATWMLTWWLERVLGQANGRMRSLSDGRYVFRLRTQQRDGRSHAGLDVDVLDTWSNQLRDVNVLSGGEKFLASLSLALGLADVVQALNGGVQLDTLFIDEGFGSLDAETLNRAMDLIDQISQHRSVGLISHVEAMQKAIFSQVRVAKSPAGSTIEVVTGGVE